MYGTHESPGRIIARDDLAGGAVARREQSTRLAAAPEQLASALSRSDAASREDVLTRLQAAGGNQEVGRMLQAGAAHTEVVRYPFTATIRKAPSAQPSPAPAGIPSRDDKPPEAGKDAHETAALIEGAPAPQQATAGGGGSAAPAGGTTPKAEATGGGSAPAPTAAAAPPQQTAGGGTEAAQATGPPQPLPDIHLPALEQVERCDQLAVVLGYSGSIAKGGATPTGFGVTRSFGSSLTNITVASAPTAYIITATLEHPITYQIRSGTGPDGQVDVGSDTAPAITAGNYANVASDLTPNMSDLNGRPPRTAFWSEDLTTKHELVHANDDKGNGPLAMVQVMGWLNGQTVSGVFDVMSTMSQVPKRFAANLLAALSTVDGEKHAYGDGAPSYKARADSIKAKGDKGDYH